MYICNDLVCDPVCDFCWYCFHDEFGVPCSCKKEKIDEFADGLGYCDEFRCSIHETKPTDWD